MVFTFKTGDNGNTMATVRIKLAAAALLVCGVAFANGTTAGAVPAAESAVSGKPAKKAPVPKAPVAAKSPASGRMQVVEPKADAPMSPARESKAWQKSHSRGLTDAQKKAFRERKESMEGMIAVIKEKRKALRDAKPEERAALARELHSLIMEKEPAAAPAAASTTARVAPAAPENSRSADNNGAESGPSAKASQREEAKKAKAAEAAEYRRKRIEAYQEQQRNKD